MSKILVPEDNTANLELIREILQLHGFGLFHQADSCSPLEASRTWWQCNRAGLALFGRSRLRLGTWRGKIHLRHLTGRFRGSEVSTIGLETCPICENIVWELLDVRVVVLQRVVIALALHGNPVLGAGELILQSHEILVRLQLRVILYDQ